MKRSLLMISLGFLFISLDANAHFPAPPAMLYLYSIHNLPSDVRPLYIYGDSVLAFGPELIGDGLPGRLLPFAYFGGDYYLMRIRDKRVLDVFSSPIRYYVMGDALIFKSIPQEAERLTKFGWGLTRLTPIKQTVTQSFVDDPPAIAVVDSDIVRAISVITPESSHQLIADLSSISTRYSFAQGCRRAEQYVFDKFDSLGLAASFFDFQYSGTNMRDVIGQLIPNRLSLFAGILIVPARRHINLLRERKITVPGLRSCLRQREPLAAVNWKRRSGSLLSAVKNKV
jgi:hypothetical protein